MRESKHRNQHREQRQRIDKLHRAFDGRKVDFAADVPDLEVVAAAAVQDDGRTSDRLTLSRFLEDEFTKRSWGKRSPMTAVRARDFALSVADLDPNPEVIAAFGAERALDLVSHHVPFDHAAPDCFVDGEVYRVGYDAITNKNVFEVDDWAGLALTDLASLRRLVVDFDSLQARRRVTAAWVPTRPVIMFTADAMRPPMEALSIAASVVRAHEAAESRTGPRIMDAANYPCVKCIGLGYAAAAQALSVMLPFYQIHHTRTPYYTALPLGNPDSEAVILNVTSPHAWQVAKMLGGNRAPMAFLVRRSILRGDVAVRDPTKHVTELLTMAIPYRRRGKPLIVIGDTLPHHEALEKLKSHGLIVPLAVPGLDLDTAQSGLWVAYPKVTWAPFGVPSPISVVMSVWRWT